MGFNPYAAAQAGEPVILTADELLNADHLETFGVFVDVSDDGDPLWARVVVLDDNSACDQDEDDDADVCNGECDVVIRFDDPDLLPLHLELDDEIDVMFTMSSF